MVVNLLRPSAFLALALMTVIFVGLLVWGPCPYDDSFIYGTVSFLALAFADLVILVGPLVLGPRPHDDSFIYGTVSFLALALLFFMGPLVSRPRPYDDSFTHGTVNFLVRMLWTWSFGLFTFANLVTHSVDSKPWVSKIDISEILNKLLLLPCICK